MFLHAWLIYPAVLAVLAWGGGLLLDRAAGGAIPRVLIVPAGLATLTVVGVVLTYLDATAELTAPALVVLAMAGFVLVLRGRPRPPHGWVWPLAAALLPFLVIAAPVLVTGQAGFTGYARIVDIGFQLNLAQQFVTEGRAIPMPALSSFEEVVGRTLGDGYPGGAQAVLGATSQVAGLDPLWAWQPFLAFTGAMLGLALWFLLRDAIAWRPGRAVAAGVAAQPTILYAYTLTGGIKELAAAALITLCAALLVAPRTDVSPARAALPVFVAVVAGLATFSLGVVPWIAVLLAVVLGPPLVRDRRLPRPSPRATAVAVASLAVVGVPIALATVKLAPVLASGGPADLGNLAAPVAPWAAIGPWLTPDHRYPLDVAGTLAPTAVLAGAVLVLAVLGLARAWARRDVGLVAVGAAGAIGLAAVVAFGSAWAELKAITTTAPLCVALAFAGAAALARTRLGLPAALAAGVLVAVAVLAGNALQYRGTSLAPSERLGELRDIADRYEDDGPALLPVYEELAEYLLREVPAVGLVNPLEGELGLRPGVADDEVVFARDLDAFTLEELRRYQLIVTRRDPAASRPSSDFVLEAQTVHYAVWERRAVPPLVVLHKPLGPGFGQRTPAVCEDVVRRLGELGAQGRMAYAAAPDGREFTASQASPQWAPGDGSFWLGRGPGRLTYEVSVPEAGSYGVWLRGSFGREVQVLVDGRSVGSLRWRGNYPEQAEPVATLELEAGEHSVEVVRGGGSLLAGTGNELGGEGTTTRVGPVLLAPTGPPAPVRTATAEEAGELCAGDEPWDWVEVVAPRR
jgi:hypothetical protein